MSTHDGDDCSGRCEMWVALSASELRMLGALEGVPAYGLDARPMRCDLEPGHAGVHQTICQSSYDPTTGLEEHWWIGWDGAQRFLAERPYCPATLPADVEEGLCHLPIGHVGRHTYERTGRR